MLKGSSVPETAPARRKPFLRRERAAKRRALSGLTGVVSGLVISGGASGVTRKACPARPPFFCDVTSARVHLLLSHPQRRTENVKQEICRFALLSGMATPIVLVWMISFSLHHTESVGFFWESLFLISEKIMGANPIYPSERSLPSFKIKWKWQRWQRMCRVQVPRNPCGVHVLMMWLENPLDYVTFDI